MNIQYKVINNKRINSLQILRIVGFVGVYTWHCGFWGFGAWGVSLFIVLSGFLMTYNYHNRNVDCSFFNCVIFSFRKISKLYLLHILMMFAALGLIFLNGSGKGVDVFPEQTIKIVINILLIQAWFPDKKYFLSLNGVSWYLSLCLFLYMAYPLINHQLKKIQRNIQAVFVMIIIFGLQCLVCVLLYFVFEDSLYTNALVHWLTYVFPIFRLGDFIIGCCLGYLYINRQDKINGVCAFIGEILAILCIKYTQYVFIDQVGIGGTECFRYTVLYTIPNVALIYLFAINKGLISKILTCKPLVYLGGVTTEAFLIHQIVIRYFSEVYYLIVGSKPDKYVKLVLPFIITIVCVFMYKNTYKIIVGRRNKLFEGKN